MDVLVVRVGVKDYHKLVAGRVEPDIPHMRVRDLVPLLSRESLVGRQRQRAVPHRADDVPPYGARDSEFRGQLSGRPAGHIAPNDGALVAAIQGISEQATKTPTATDIGLHGWPIPSSNPSSPSSSSNQSSGGASPSASPGSSSGLSSIWRPNRASRSALSSHAA